jgi:hypothetical protein
VAAFGFFGFHSTTRRVVSGLSLAATAAAIATAVP